jgi:protein-L-isoaspartate(D-aspartate) O-methyltransferase
LFEVLRREDSAMPVSVKTARRFYAEELRFSAHVESRSVVDAFATVPRERFVGPGPWQIKSPMRRGDYWTTANADPRNVYHDTLIALDAKRGINNGQPSLWIALFDELGIAAGEHVVHLGCGTGYYSAVAAPADTIFTSAGATHPLPAWLDALRPNGRLLMPMTADDQWGGMLLVTRRQSCKYAARFVCSAGFIEFSGARDAGVAERLATAFRRDRGLSVKSLR